jgi:hypothetical protein
MTSPSRSSSTHSKDKGPDPSLPHERDQTGNKGETSGVQPGNRNIIRQAHDDIESGQQDTDMHDQRTLEDVGHK